MGNVPKIARKIWLVHVLGGVVQEYQIFIYWRLDTYDCKFIMNQLLISSHMTAFITLTSGNICLLMPGFEGTVL